MLKVSDKSLLEWWLKDCLDLSQRRKSGTYGHNSEYYYPNGEVAWAVICTVGALTVSIMLLIGFLALVVATKGILLFVLILTGALGYGVWKLIDNVLNGGNS